jgi:hypothetical protein
MRLGLLCVLLFVAACSAEKSRVQVGVTSAAQLVEQLGSPQSIEAPAPGVQSYVFEQDVKYQVQDEVVVAQMREPVGEETSLIYWRHQFRDCATTFAPLGSSDGHLEELMELACPEKGLKIIYDPNVEKVVRVVQHAH